MNVFTTTALATAVLFASCANEGSDGIQTANALCPMGNEPVVAGGGEMTWRDVSIGFCCKRCQPMFEALSDAEKLEALLAVGVDVGDR